MLLAFTALVVLIVKMKKLRVKSKEVIDRFTPLVEAAEDLETVNKLWDELHSECLKEVGDGMLFKLHHDYQQAFFRLNTILSTKFKMLNKK